MSQPHNPQPVLFFLSILYNKTHHQEKSLVQWIQNELGQNIGEFGIFTSELCPMKRYYSHEMGDEEDLERFFLYSLRPQSRELLIEFKLKCIELEKKVSKENQRTVNLDVGFVSLENLVLATGKMFTHRVYLGSGVCADLTLIYQKDEFQELPWTYPDYGSRPVREFFAWLRKILHVRLTQMDDSKDV